MGGGECSHRARLQEAWVISEIRELQKSQVRGYMRVALNFIAFGYCISFKMAFAVLYFTSFLCDGIDGYFARKYKQVSTFGAVLDMVTDRVSTACLLVLLSHCYRPCMNFFLFLLALDISSHWFQMYSTPLSRKTSHKDVKDSASWLMKMYYGHRYFMAYCCVGCEVLYIILFFLSERESESVADVLLHAANKGVPLYYSLPTLFFLPGWAIKQVVNLIQLKTAADACVAHDVGKRQKP